MNSRYLNRSPKIPSFIAGRGLLYGGGPPPTFSPMDIAGLLLWLDAKDVASITKDGSDLVSQWSDKSGNGNHAIQSTMANQPLYLTTGFNTLPTIQIAGSPRGFNLTSVLIAGPKTVLIAIQQDMGSYSTFLYDTAGAGTFWAFFGANSAEIYASTFSDFAGAYTQLVPQISTITTTNVNTGTSCNMYKNGSVLMPAGSGNCTDARFSQIGSADNPGDWFNGRISELLIYNSVLSSANKTTVESYLMARWAL